MKKKTPIVKHYSDRVFNKLWNKRRRETARWRKDQARVTKALVDALRAYLEFHHKGLP